MQNSDGPAIQADKDAPLQPSTITASTGQLPSIAEDREVHIEILKDQGLLDKEARDAIARRWTKIEQDMLQTKLKPSDYMPEQEEFSWVRSAVLTSTDCMQSYAGLHGLSYYCSLYYEVYLTLLSNTVITLYSSWFVLFFLSFLFCLSSVLYSSGCTLCYSLLNSGNPFGCIGYSGLS